MTEIPTPPAPSSLRAVAAASMIGTIVEWYDFFLYGTAAALVFNRLFFPTLSPLAGTMAAFATFGVGFVARPVGGIVLGHFGDRVGRKAALVTTLLLMGAATCLIGVLPPYASIGVWAPIGLVILRLAQGFGVGGEWGGAVLIVVEHAPAGRRGLYGSFAQVGVPAGLGLATVVFGLFSRLPEDQFLSWGWRVPFLLSAVLVLIGLIIRTRIVETPLFAELRDSRDAVRSPFHELFRTRASVRRLVEATGTRIAENGAFYIYSTFAVTYATRAGLSRAAILGAITMAAAIEVFTIPGFGALSDRIGRRPVYLFGTIVMAVSAYPFFRLISTGSTTLVDLSLIVGLAVAHAAMYGPQAAFIAEMFPTGVRYSGMSFAAQMASVAAGAMAPAVATALLAAYGERAVAIYMIAMAAVTIAAVLSARETAYAPLERDS